MAWVQFVPLISILVWLGALTLFVLRVARRPGMGARRLTALALVVAAIAGISFVLWPVEIAYASSGRVDFDAATGVTTRSSSEQVALVWLPNVKRLGAGALVVGAVPVALTALPYLWQRFLLPSTRTLRLAGVVALIAWFFIGTVSSVSWWSVPATVALLSAAGREEGAV